MTLPIDAAVIAAMTEQNHLDWHNEMDGLLPALNLPTVTSASSAHNDHHELLRKGTRLGLPPPEIVERQVGHRVAHRMLHLYLTRGPQPGVTQPAGSVAVAPGSSIASAITTAGNGGTVWLQAGTHRVTAAVTPRTGQLILGEPGAIVDGSVLIGGSWTVSGSQSWAAAQLPATASTTGVCDGGGTLCQPAEDVFLDGVKLTPVANQAAVVSGTFWADYTNNRIYLATADSPSTKVVEQAKCDQFIGNSTGTNGGWTVRNLTIRKFASPYQKAMIVANHSAATSTNFITVDQCRFEHGHADGVGSFSDWAVIRRNIIDRAGSVGIKAFSANNMTVEGNETIQADLSHFDPGWEAGGLKVVTIDDMLIQGNVFRDGYANGAWVDIDARRVTFQYNGVHNNAHHGYHYEISYDGTVQHNWITDSADSGLQWNASARGTVSDNVLEGNGMGLRFIADPNRQTTDPPTYPLDERDLYGVAVSNNAVDHRNTDRYAAAIVLQSGAPTSHLSEVTFTNDTYRLGYRGDDAFYYNTPNTFTAWQGNGKDTGGTRSGPLALNTFEGIADETTVTTANSGGSSGLAFQDATVVAGGTLVADTARQVKGTSRSLRAAVGATAGSARVGWTTNIGTLTGTFWVRMYLYFTANPSASIRLMQLLSGGASLATGMLINASGNVQLLNAASGGTVQVSPIALNQWVRIEAMITLSTTVGQHEIKKFDVDPYADVADAAQTVTSAATLALLADVDTYRFGHATSTGVTNIGPFWMAKLAVSTEGYIGP